MYKVMLVDDDIPMLEYLSVSISWESLGLTVTAQENSSLRALEQFERQQPDLVLTDIGLPQMNGLELAGRMKELKPDTVILFLTCHEDFHYAKQAVRLSAADYLIKDELTPKLLEASLTKAIAVLKSAEQQRGNQFYREDIYRNKDLLKQAFSERVMKGGASEALLPYALRLGMDWRQPDCLVGAVFPHYSTYSPRYAYFDPLARYGMYNLAEELSGRQGMVTALPYGEYLLLVFNYKHSLQTNSVMAFRAYMEELQAKCREYIKIECGFWYDLRRHPVSALGNALRSLLDNRLQGYYSTDPLFQLGAPEEAGPPATLHALLAPLKEELLEGAKGGEADRVRAALNGFGHAAGKHRPEPETFLAYCLQLVRSVEALRFDAEEESFAACMQHTLRLHDTLRLMEVYFATLMEKGDGSPGQPHNVKLQTIDRYIAEHVAFTVSSTDMAEHLNLNPSYFSRYFKKMTGINFTDYVHQFKMSLAVRLLDKNDATIESTAAKLGYSDRNYFSKVFKKYVGIAPGEYKKKT